MAEQQREVPYQHPKPAPGQFRKPVVWLLGPHFIASLKQMAMYAIYKGGFDPRDWMHAEPYLCEVADGATEFWFDYLADTGDGQKATYSVAYLCQTDLYRDGQSLTTTAKDGAPCLPRGQFLFVGGDTAYHVADYGTLALQFQGPFRWAHADLYGHDGDGQPRRPIFGIPGNHDYFDQLDGFNRQFRRPCSGESEPGADPRAPDLALPGFERRQEASYVAVELPFGWHLWGVDTEDNKLDFRQKIFFAERNGGSVPDKLIVCTPTPSTRLGVRAPKGGAHDLLFESLGLDSYFVRDDPTPEPGRCRLDLSGDVHHYARYWGKTAGESGDTPDAPECEHYASVVSGLGGAFHHATVTDRGQVRAQQLYPSKEESYDAFASRLCSPLAMYRGGFVRVFGALFALMLYLSATAFSQTRPIVDSVFAALGLSVQQAWSTGHQQPLVIGNGTPFLQSMAVLLSIGVSAVLVWLSFRRSRTLYRQSRRQAVPAWRYGPSWFLIYAAVGLPIVVHALVRPPGGVLGDIVFALIVLSLTVGLVALAVVVGGELHGVLGKIGFGLIGLVHGALQLFVPVLMVRVGDVWTLAWLPVAIGVFWWLGCRAMRHRRRRVLVLGLWLLLGGLCVGVPLWRADGVVMAPDSIWTAVAALCVVAPLGMMLSCLWLGWYLAVSLCFDGHNNEAGGAARVERFKEFIRFRVTPDEIRGYVIAVDDPQEDGAKLQAKVVDEFFVRPR